MGIYDGVSIWTATPVPILLHVSFYLSSVTELWDMIIGLCVCNGQIGHANDLDIKSRWQPMDVISSCPLLVSETIKSKLQMKLAKKI